MVLTITMASVCQQNASMELIPGMDKLLNHMKEQDKKIKTLTEENKALKEKCECVERQRDSCCDRLSEKLKEEDEKQEESEEMEYCNGVCCERSPKHGISWWKSYGFNSPCKCAYTIKRQEENKKLEEENKKLKEELDIWVNPKGQVVMNQEGMMLYESSQEENKKLKEEIKKLKKEHIQNMMKTIALSTELYREMKYALGYGEFDEPDRKEMYEEIKKLKEKITCLESDSHNEVSQAEHEEQMENTLASLNFYKECNEELKEEIKKLKE